MENTKKIRKEFILISLLLFASVFSCTNNIIYYNVNHNHHHHIISKPKGLKNVKGNIYIDDNKNIYFTGTYLKIIPGENGEAISEEAGVFLQDSLNFNEVLLPLKSIIDIESYSTLDKKYWYKDKNHVYFNYNNTGQQNMLPPIIITSLSPNEIKVLSGNYIIDNKNVYYYSNSKLADLSSVDMETFSIIKFKNTEIDNHYFYLGKDKNHLYQFQDQLSKEDLLDIPIERKAKDSLINLYF